MVAVYHRFFAVKNCEFCFGWKLEVGWWYLGGGGGACQENGFRGEAIPKKIREKGEVM